MESIRESSDGLTFVLFFGTANRPGVEDSDDDVPIFAGRASRTPPTVKKACDEPRGESRRKRRHRPRIATRQIDKVISRVLAGAEAVELIRPDEDACDLDRNVAELINVCIEHPRVRSLELQVSDVQDPLGLCMPKLKPIFLWPLAGNSVRCDGGASLRSCREPRARDAQRWQPTRLLGPDGIYAERWGGTLAG